jgi:hypothetical protein
MGVAPRGAMLVWITTALRFAAMARLKVPSFATVRVRKFAMITTRVPPILFLAARIPAMPNAVLMKF